MNAARCLPVLLAGITLIVLLGNALPAAHRKHRLQREERRLLGDYRDEARRHDRLLAERAALQDDPFYLERLYTRTWAKTPDGAIPLEAALRPAPPFAE